METYKLGEFTVDLVDNPAQSLSKKEQYMLVQQAIPVTRKAFGNEGVTETDIITHAIEVSTAIYLKNKYGDLLAFSTCVPEDVTSGTIVHLKGTAVRPESQGKGFYSILIPLRVLVEAEKHPNKKLLVGTRTQNPRVYEKSIKLGLFPKYDQPTPEYLKPVACDYAALVREKHSDFQSEKGLEFDSDVLVARRAYGFVNEAGQEETFCMYGDNVPKARDERINQFINNNLDFQNGDAVILIGSFSRENCLNMLRGYRGDVSEILQRFSNR